MSPTAAYPVPKHPWVFRIEASLYAQVLPPHCTDEDLASMLREVERITTTIYSALGWVTDVSHILRASARQRNMYADSDRRLAPFDKRLCAGTAVICSGAMTRGILTAVHWLSPPEYPFKTFSSHGEGERWARQQLSNRGVSIGLEATADWAAISSIGR